MRSGDWFFVGFFLGCVSYWLLFMIMDKLIDSYYYLLKKHNEHLQSFMKVEGD